MNRQKWKAGLQTEPHQAEKGRRNSRILTRTTRDIRTVLRQQAMGIRRAGNTARRHAFQRGSTGRYKRVHDWRKTVSATSGKTQQSVRTRPYTSGVLQVVKRGSTRNNPQVFQPLLAPRSIPGLVHARRRGHNIQKRKTEQPDGVKAIPTQQANGKQATS